MLHIVRIAVLASVLVEMPEHRSIALNVGLKFPQMPKHVQAVAVLFEDLEVIQEWRWNA
jgi:hypothetical protein